MMVNWEFMDNMTPASAVQLVDDLREGKEVTSTRGPRICTWREAERVLAGFPDDRADEGPAAGEASLLGLRVARSNGWAAPAGRDAGRGAASGTSPLPSDAVGAAAESDATDDESAVRVDRAGEGTHGGKDEVDE
jgi:NADH-quinone oxidoreductase subunit E